VLGTAELVEDATEKIEALRAVSDQIIDGRWDEVRQPSQKELKATSVLRLPLKEASAKIRSGPPKDDEEDYALPIWAGVLPLNTRPGEPVQDPSSKVPAEIPGSVRKYSRVK